MTVQQKYDAKWVTVIITVVGMLVGAFAWNTRVAITYGKEQQGLENTIKSIQSNCEYQIHQNKVNIEKQDNRFSDHCEAKRISDEKLWIKVDDIAMKQVKVVTNQEIIIKKIDELDKP